MDDRYLRELARRETLPLPESYDRRMDRLCEEIRAGTLARPRHRLPYRRTLLLAAVIAALLSVSVLAASGTLSEILRYLQGWNDGGLTPEQESAVLRDTAVLEQSVTDNGVTVTLKEAYGDGMQFFFHLTVELPEGTDCEEPRFETELLVNDWEGGSCSISTKHLPQEDSDGNLKTLLLVITKQFDQSPQPGERLSCTLRLENIISGYDESGPVIVMPGDWSMEFELVCDSSSESMELEGIFLEGNASLTGNDIQTAELELFTLRPLGARMMYHTDALTGEVEMPWPVVLMADGSEVQLWAATGGHIYEDGNFFDAMYTGHNFLDYEAKAPILLDQVTAIRFGDLVIPWEPRGE